LTHLHYKKEPMQNPDAPMAMTNQATRMLAIFDRFTSMNHKRTVAHGVSRWFEGDAPPSEPWEVASAAMRLTTVLEELERLESLLASRQLRTFAAFEEHTAQLRNAVLGCLSGLQSAWANHAPQFAPAERTALKIWANALEDNEVVLDASELEDLGVALRELEHLSREPSTPEALREVLLGQVAILKKAIGEYLLRGGRGFVDIVLQAAAEMRRRSDVLVNAPTEVTSGLKRVWDTTMRVIAPLNQGKEVVEIVDMASRVAMGVYLLTHQA
jgi:hypothetical protein